MNAEATAASHPSGFGPGTTADTYQALRAWTFVYQALRAWTCVYPRVMNTEATAASHPSGFGPGEDITIKLARLVHPYLSEAPARQTPAGGKQLVVLRHVRVLEHSGGGD